MVKVLNTEVQNLVERVYWLFTEYLHEARLFESPKAAIEAGKKVYDDIGEDWDADFAEGFVKILTVSVEPAKISKKLLKN